MVTGRLCVPPQVPDEAEQLVQGPLCVAPHEVSMGTLQALDSVDALFPHAPEAHTCVVTERLCVPVQESAAEGVQALQAP